MTLFHIGFLPVNLFDLLDILVVALILYRLFIMLRGTRALSMLVGLAIILMVSFVSQWLRLNSLHWVVEKLTAVWILAFLIVFQPELRGILAQLGRGRFFSRFIGGQRMQVQDKLIKAISQMSQDKIGALIAVQGNIGLRGYADTGKPINAEVQASLIVSMFIPPGPLHDGAVIIENDRIIAAGAVLPLTQNPQAARGTGMRHQAGLGLAEETDALVLIVSEETGMISVARDGKLRRGLDITQVRGLLSLALETEGK